MGKIKVYHGTIYNFDLPSLSKCKIRKDFGRGFYLADDISHAKGIAEKGYFSNPNNTQKFIYAYKISIQEMRDIGLNIHEFNSTNYAWLDFVLRNRCLLTVENYDVVIGPTADKNAQDDIEEFYKQFGLNANNHQKDILLNRLNTTKYGKQYCFKTDRAIKYLNENFIGRRSF
jgi:hypothetical protein